MTVIAAWLASNRILDLWSVIVVVVLADVIGDLGYYALGRWGLHRLPKPWRDRLGLNRARLYILARHFRNHGTRTLLLGKFTQAFGAPVLIAAGLGKLPIWKFTWVNFLATIPKSLVFVAIGYSIGAAYSRIDDWMGRASLLDRRACCWSGGAVAAEPVGPEMTRRHGPVLHHPGLQRGGPDRRGARRRGGARSHRRGHRGRRRVERRNRRRGRGGSPRRSRNMRVLRQPVNAGKTRAVAAGVMAARHDHLMLLDSDLAGLTPAHLSGLIAPVAEGRAEVSISLRRNAPRFRHLIGIDYISGERVMPRDVLAERARRARRTAPATA